MEVDAVVLAGGASARMGEDKAIADVGGARLLDRVLAAAQSCSRVIVVGPPRPAVGAHVLWVQEEPPGGGPVHGLATGVAHCTAPWVAVLACDLPFLSEATIGVLSRAVSTRDGAVATGSRGPNPLCAVYRRDALVAALAGGETRGARMKDIVDRLDLALVPDETATRDCDTPADLARARQEMSRSTRSTY